MDVSGSAAVCKNGHSFDRAREGYFYLLPANAKNSASPGDNKEMVSAREKFLSTGSYAPLAARIAELITLRFPSAVTLLDAGVGTGYYMSKISEARGGKDRLIGVDISKQAVRRAARANRGAFMAVASVYSLPIATASVDVAISVFSPFADRELARVLKDGGILIAAAPAENHLAELRRMLYDNVLPVEGSLTSSHLALLSRERSSFSFSLDGSDNISALLGMTPYVYRAPLDRIAAVRATSRMRLSADFYLYTFIKNPS